MSERQAGSQTCADVETSSEDYASRFASKAGTWMLQVQTDATLKLMNGELGQGVLDVGGGHGQLARPLCEAGAKMVVLGSDPICENRVRDLVEAGLCEFIVGDPLALPLDAGSYHTVLCFRLVCHCDEWPTLINELCKTASSRIIIDFPTSQSLNVFTGLLFGMKKKVEKNTRTYTLFKPSELLEVFESFGWRVEGQIRQFFWPMVVHRMLNCPPVSIALEWVPRVLGLTRLLGSPMIMSFRKDG